MDLFIERWTVSVLRNACQSRRAHFIWLIFLLLKPYHVNTVWLKSKTVLIDDDDEMILEFVDSTNSMHATLLDIFSSQSSTHTSTLILYTKKKKKPRDFWSIIDPNNYNALKMGPTVSEGTIDRYLTVCAVVVSSPRRSASIAFLRPSPLNPNPIRHESLVTAAEMVISLPAI